MGREKLPHTKADQRQKWRDVAPQDKGRNPGCFVFSIDGKSRKKEVEGTRVPGVQKEGICSITDERERQRQRDRETEKETVYELWHGPMSGQEVPAQPVTSSLDTDNIRWATFHHG